MFSVCYSLASDVTNVDLLKRDKTLERDIFNKIELANPIKTSTINYDSNYEKFKLANIKCNISKERINNHAKN